MSVTVSVSGYPGSGLHKTGYRDEQASRPAVTPAASSEPPVEVSGGADPMNTLSVLLTRLSVVGGTDSGKATSGHDAGGSGAASASAGGAVSPPGDDPGDATVRRPNLDALNRVLAHYAAQSAAASLPFLVIDN